MIGEKSLEKKMSNSELRNKVKNRAIRVLQDDGWGLDDICLAVSLGKKRVWFVLDEEDLQNSYEKAIDGRDREQG